MLPLKADIRPEGTCHVKDLESGEWAVYDVRGWRIRMLRASDMI